MTKKEYSVLIDGYTRIIKHNKQYIPIELCQIVFFYVNNNIFDFFIIFEKGTFGETNELLCFNIEKKKNQ